MFANERYDLILGLLKTQRSVTVSELMEKFGVSIETIRRDLAFLEKRGQLTRVHGGAIAAAEKMRVLGELSVRLSENSELKRELSLKAAELLSEGDIIALDSGSTSMEFVKVLCEKFEKLTILTYSRDILNVVADKPGFTLILTGGSYCASERVFNGFLAEESIKRLHVSKCFIFPSGVSVKYGITINIGEFYSLQRALMSISDLVYILADSTKFERASKIRLCGLNETAALVTDSRLDDAVLKLYEEKGTEVLRWKS